MISSVHLANLPGFLHLLFVALAVGVLPVDGLDLVAELLDAAFLAGALMVFLTPTLDFVPFVVAVFLAASSMTSWAATFLGPWGSLVGAGVPGEQQRQHNGVSYGLRGLK